MPLRYFALMLALVISAAALTVWGASRVAPEWALPGLLVVTLGAALALRAGRR